MTVETNTLEYMCELIVDCPHSTPKWTDSGLIVLRNQNIKNGTLDLSNPSYTNEEDFQERIKRAVPQVGDIVFTREAPMGEVCLIPEGLKCCLGQRQVLLRPKKEVNGKYLFWALQSPYVQRQISWNEGTGSTVSNVRIPIIKNLNIPRHKNQEDQIADILSSIADKIALNLQINQTLETIAQAIFKSWFVDFEPVKAKIAAIEAGEDTEGVTRAAMSAISGKTDKELDQLQAEKPECYIQLKTTAELFPSAMQDSKFGEIPEGWKVTPFSKLAKLDTTSVKPHKEPDKLWEHYSIPSFDVDEAPVLELGSEIKSNKYKVNPTAILSSKLNPNIPRTWWPDVEDDTSAICSTEFMQFIPTDEAQRAFIFGLITSGPFQSGIKQRVTGSTGSRQRAQPSSVAEMDVVKPKEELVLEYCLHLAASFVLKAKNIKENITLAKLRDTLLPKLLSGNLPVDAIEVEGVDV